MTTSRIFIQRFFLCLSLKAAFLLLFLLVTVLPAMAQGPGGDPEGDPDLVPVDGGLGFLLAAGVGYGVKKAREYKKRMDN
jgi:hypothetical protein